MVVTDPAEGDQLLDAVQRRANNLGRLALAGELEREEEGLDLDARRVRLRQHGRRFRRLLDCRKKHVLGLSFHQLLPLAQTIILP